MIDNGMSLPEVSSGAVPGAAMNDNPPGQGRVSLRSTAVCHLRLVRAPAAIVVAAALLALIAGCAALLPKPLPPHVSLETVRVTRLAAADARFTLGLVIDNPNAYDLAVTAFDVRVAVEGEPLASGSLAAPTVVAAGGTTRVAIEARAALAAFAAVIERFTRQASVRYEVTGSVVVQDGLRLPFARRGELSAADLLGAPR
jgi:LEA14-like dessication related protein